MGNFLSCSAGIKCGLAEAHPLSLLEVLLREVWNFILIHLTWLNKWQFAVWTSDRYHHPLSLLLDLRWRLINNKPLHVMSLIISGCRRNVTKWMQALSWQWMDFTRLYAELKISQELACFSSKANSPEDRQHHTRCGELCVPTLPAQRGPYSDRYRKSETAKWGWYHRFRADQDFQMFLVWQVKDLV